MSVWLALMIAVPPPLLAREPNACEALCMRANQMRAVHYSAIEAQCRAQCDAEAQLPIFSSASDVADHPNERVRVSGKLEVVRTPKAPAAPPEERYVLVVESGVKIPLTGPGVSPPPAGLVGKKVVFAAFVDEKGLALHAVSLITEAKPPKK